MALAWAAYTGKPDSAAEILEQALARHPLDSISPIQPALCAAHGHLQRGRSPRPGPALQSEYERVVPLQERQGIPFALSRRGNLPSPGVTRRPRWTGSNVPAGSGGAAGRAPPSMRVRPWSNWGKKTRLFHPTSG
jgi:hypothetical protein